MTPIEAKALDETAKTAKTFFGKILGPMADEFGQQLADNIRTRRLKNQLENLKKVQAIVQKEGITMKEINFKAMFPLLEGMALEEDETLQQMWANLFTNYVDASKNLVSHVYPDVLRQLSSEEVEILKKMRGNGDQIIARERNVLMGEPLVPYTYTDLLTNMVRLGLVEGALHAQLGNSNLRDVVRQITRPDRFVITEFGLQFLDACTR